MISSGIVARWFAFVGMSCLTVLGAAPRLDCLCADQSCQIACEQPLAHVLPTADSDCSSERACCCHHDQPAPEPAHGPALEPAGCHCPMQIVGTKLSAPERVAAKQPLSQTSWLNGDELELAAAQTAPTFRYGRFTGLPPDDPVSRGKSCACNRARGRISLPSVSDRVLRDRLSLICNLHFAICNRLALQATLP